MAKNPAVRHTQLSDLVDLAEGLSQDQYNKYEIAKMLIEHMQKYYGWST